MLALSRLEQHALEDLSLRNAAFRPLPCFESIIENTATDTMFLLVRALGKDQSDPVLDLLRLLDVTIAEEPVGTIDVSEYAVAFLFDASGEGVAATLAAFRSRYGEHFGDLGNLVEHGKWVTEAAVPVGCFVFHRHIRDQDGTLEDHLAPMVGGVACTVRRGKAFVDENRSTGDRVSNRDADRLKAIITATGQFDHPGAPMSTIIGRTELPRARFDASPLSEDLADFLAQTLWNNP